MAKNRKRPEDFLELVERAKRGRLKVYIGSAAGVGKTYQMLEEAHALKKRGIDIVLAFIETHGRAETATLIDGLEVIPRKSVEYKGVAVEEMDLDAVLKRHPQVAIVDELAHTNAPFCRNKKRYQDVLELLEAGINVICAFNVQHLEGINDMVKQATGVIVRETVPDSILKRADQVVDIDLAVEDLIDRLRAGKIYAPDKVSWALENFFQPEKLSVLREIALREVAESVDRSVSSKANEEDAARRAAASERVMVCLASHPPPHGVMLLRQGSRLAGRLNTDWFVVHVQTKHESPQRIDAETQRHLIEDEQKARDLGAEVVRLQSEHPVEALLDFARAHGVRHIVVGRSQQPWWRRRLGQSPVFKLVNEAVGFDLHIVSLEDRET
ncbi:MAG TPA: universal stress protein [Candidatus Acidoferrales bacterium]|jgi:two-component system, OmpR family, sensor histidine kinase KdpD|nr:universal stress protein [Candidatus Acidoferrales bacterium]